MIFKKMDVKIKKRTSKAVLVNILLFKGQGYDENNNIDFIQEYYEFWCPVSQFKQKKFSFEIPDWLIKKQQKRRKKLMNANWY